MRKREKKNGNGLYILLEGGEGAGKTSQVRFIAEHFAALGKEVVLTKEPGASEVGAGIRGLLLDPKHTGMDLLTEVFLFLAARSQNIVEVVMPALKRGAVVIQDRGVMSNLVYQGVVRGFDQGELFRLNRLATKNIRPDLTLVLDIDPETGMVRNRAAGKNDRFELQAVEFHARVREGFLSLAALAPGTRVIDASGSEDGVFKQIQTIINERWKVNISKRR